MFNLSTVGNVGYNGISQLSESRCTPQFNSAERTTTPSGTKMRFNNAGGRNKYTTGFKMPLYANVRNASPDTRLKVSNPKEDVYTFNDVDTPAITSKTPNSFLKESLTSKKTDSVCTKKTLTGSLLTSSKKVPIGNHHVNGFNFWKDGTQSELKNGIHKPNNAGESSKTPQTNRKWSAKQCKDFLEPPPLQQNIKLEPNNASTSNLHTEGLNHSSKNSIISFNNFTSSKSILICQDKKISDVVKKESILKGGTSVAAAIGSNKNVAKTQSKKSTPGKPHNLSPKVHKGRGPALHEALQRINPSISTLPSKNILSNEKWHAPSSSLFDCGPLSTTAAKIDSDSSDDYASDCVDCLDSDDSNDASDRSDKIVATRTKLRRKISLLNQLRKISDYPESAFALYNSVKTQMRKQRKTSSSEGFRLENPTLDVLLASQGASNLLSSADKRKMKYGNRSDTVRCAQPGCMAPTTASARLCLSHVSVDPEQRLLSECTAKFTDNTRCKVPILDVRNELTLCSENTPTKDNYGKNNLETKPKKAARKRSKSSLVRPPKRNRKKKPSISGSKSNPTDEDYSKLKEDVNLFSSSSTIGNNIKPTFLNHDDTTELNVCSNSSACESPEGNVLVKNELISSPNPNQHIVDPDVVAEVLAMHESGDLPSLDLPTAGPAQDANIDISSVFNDIFIEQNGEYIPTREETEELERALEAVNQDVKSMEKFTNSQHSSLLDTFLDEKALAETLESFPDVFGNIPLVKVSTDPTSSPS